MHLTRAWSAKNVMLLCAASTARPRNMLPADATDLSPTIRPMACQAALLCLGVRLDGFHVWEGPQLPNRSRGGGGVGDHLCDHGWQRANFEIGSGLFGVALALIMRLQDADPSGMA